MDTLTETEPICKCFLYIKFYLEQWADYKDQNETLRFETRVSRHELCCDDDL